MTAIPIPRADQLAESVPHAAERSGIGRTTLFEAIRRGELPAKKIGRRTVVLVEDLQDWLASRPARTSRGGHHD